jgi:dCTP deaminase
VEALPLITQTPNERHSHSDVLFSYLFCNVYCLEEMSMTILSAQTIRGLCAVNGAHMVSPFNDRLVNNGLSGGLTCAGYDLRIAQDIVLYPVTLPNLVLKMFGAKRPSFSLASAIEKFHMPVNVMGFVLDKSTWARQGLAVQTTCIEPGWNGYLTLELTNHGDAIISLEKGMPIAQVVFHRLDKFTDHPYSGKYSDQGPEPQEAIYEV